MPTYSYACTACEHRFDAQQAFTDDALTECPRCGGRLRKLFGNVGVVFKGSGFYRNDARSGSSTSSGSSGSGSSTAATTSGSAGGVSGASSGSSGSSSTTSATSGSTPGSSSGGSAA